MPKPKTSTKAGAAALKKRAARLRQEKRMLAKMTPAERERARQRKLEAEGQVTFNDLLRGQA